MHSNKITTGIKVLRKRVYASYAIADICNVGNDRSNNKRDSNSKLRQQVTAVIQGNDRRVEVVKALTADIETFM